MMTGQMLMISVNTLLRMTMLNDQFMTEADNPLGTYDLEALLPIP
jgi:hypothetical protein